MNFKNNLLSRKFLNYSIIKQCNYIVSKNCSNKTECAKTYTTKPQDYAEPQTTKPKDCAKDGTIDISKYKSVVGLEVHAQILSKSKLLSGASTSFNAPVNDNVALFDAAIPGTLPVLNRACVEAAVKTALALKCCINPVSVFDRKHYFYADLPSGFQITQQRRPIAHTGQISFDVSMAAGNCYPKTSTLKQLQLEQDSGKMLHDNKRSLVDLNRAGVGLMEFVFEPDLADGEEAASLVKELCLILNTINTSYCKMEEGGLRVDANVSVHKEGEPLGQRTEIKNIGSIRGVADAITYEINRQMDLIKKNEQNKIVNETRAWDSIQKKTCPMREKETKNDYRFMIEPNLPPIHLHMPGTRKLFEDMVSVEKLQQDLPKLPNQMRMELIEIYGLPPTSAHILVNDNVLYNHFLTIINGGDRKPSTVTNILVMELLTILNKENKKLTDNTISSESLGDLVDMYAETYINLVTVRKVLTEIVNGNSNDPRTIVDKNNWSQINGMDEIESMCVLIIQDNPKLVKQYKAGKQKVFKALLGCLATATQHRINMVKATTVMEKLLRK